MAASPVEKINVLFLNSGLILYYKWNFNGFQQRHQWEKLATWVTFNTLKINPREMLIILTHLGPTALVWSSFTFLAFLSTGCLAFRLVDRHLSTVQSTSGFFEVVLFVCHHLDVRCCPLSHAH